MAGMLIIKPLTIAAVTASSGSGADNLTGASPREIWAADSAGFYTFDIDLGVASDVDSFFMGFTNAAPGTTWRIEATTDMAGAGAVILAANQTLALADQGDDPARGFVRLGAPITSRFFRISITQTSAPLQAGILILGKAFEHAYEYKSGRTLIDLSQRTDLQSGGFAISEGAVKVAFNWTFSDLNDDQRDALFSICKSVGESSPILMVEATDGAIKHNHLHYGLFDRFEQYEREEPGETRWAFKVVGWS